MRSGASSPTRAEAACRPELLEQVGLGLGSSAGGAESDQGRDKTAAVGRQA
jgi:hypothetical protein